MKAVIEGRRKHMAPTFTRESLTLNEHSEAVALVISPSLLSYLITEEVPMDAGNELQRARHVRGLSLRKLAGLAGTSAAAISQIENGLRGVSVERYSSLLSKTRHRIITLPTLANTATEVAESIALFLAENDNQAAYREFISFSDSLKKQTSGIRVALTLVAPETTGSALYDAAIASLVEHWLTDAASPLPEWLDNSELFLPDLQHLREGIYGPTPEPEEVSFAFLRHNVLFPEIAMESV